MRLQLHRIRLLALCYRCFVALMNTDYKQVLVLRTILFYWFF